MWERDNWHELMDSKPKKTFNPAKRRLVAELLEHHGSCGAAGA